MKPGPAADAKVRLERLAASHEAEFLAAAARSRRLHGSWVAAPADATAFRALATKMAQPEHAGFVVRRLADDALAGYFAISNIVRGQFRSAFLGYYAFAGCEGQGLMSAGLRLVVRAAFGELKLHRIEANIQPGNAASIALVKSCGFRQEGFSPRYLKIAGRWRDHERWAILADG